MDVSERARKRMVELSIPAGADTATLVQRIGDEMAESARLRAEVASLHSQRGAVEPSERWWIVITRNGNVYPMTNPSEAAKWEGKAAEIIGPLVPAPGTPGGDVSAALDEEDH